MSMPASFCRFTTSATARSISSDIVFGSIGLAGLALDQELGDRLVARQAADMRGQDAVAAGEHLSIPQKERAQSVARRLAYRKIEAVHNGKPKPARRHRVLSGRLVLVKRDLHAGDRRASHAPRRPAPAADGDSVGRVGRTAPRCSRRAGRCRDSPSAGAHRAAPAPRPSPCRRGRATGRRSARCASMMRPPIVSRLIMPL